MPELFDLVFQTGASGHGPDSPVSVALASAMIGDVQAAGGSWEHAENGSRYFHPWHMITRVTLTPASGSDSDEES